MINELRIILTVVCLASILSKIHIHKYLDKKNNYLEKSSFPMRVNPIFIFPYFNEVSKETEKAKLLCNILWVVFLICLFVLAVNSNS